MKWGTASRLALKSSLFDLWFIVGLLLVVGGIFLFISGITLAFFASLFLAFFGFLVTIFRVSSGVFVEKDGLSLKPVEVTYEDGLAAILGLLIKENVSRKPAKVNMVRGMKGSVVVRVEDLNATATVEFNQGRITVYNGQPAKGKFAMISGSFVVMNALAFGRAGMLKTLCWILTRKLKIKGIRTAMKFQKILS